MTRHAWHCPVDGQAYCPVTPLFGFGRCLRRFGLCTPEMRCRIMEDPGPFADLRIIFGMGHGQDCPDSGTDGIDAGAPVHLGRPFECEVRGREKLC